MSFDVYRMDAKRPGLAWTKRVETHQQLDAALAEGWTLEPLWSTPEATEKYMGKAFVNVHTHPGDAE